MRRTIKQQDPHRSKLTGDTQLLKLHPTARHEGLMKYEPCYHTLMDNYVEGEYQIVTPDQAYLYQSIRRHGTAGVSFSVREYAERLRWSPMYLIHCLDRLEDAGLLRREKIVGFPLGGAPFDLVSIDPLPSNEFKNNRERIMQRVFVQQRIEPKPQDRVLRDGTLIKAGTGARRLRLGHTILEGYTAITRHELGKGWFAHSRHWNDIVAIIKRKVAKSVHEITLLILNSYPKIGEQEFLNQFNLHFQYSGFKQSYIIERTALEWKRKLERGGFAELDALVR